jgi:hypothetical protein
MAKSTGLFVKRNSLTDLCNENAVHFIGRTNQSLQKKVKVKVKFSTTP